LRKEDGTYFTHQEEKEFYNELEEYFEWMCEKEEKELEETENIYCDF
jgi:hypothetical protein